jgi:quinol monooxygenase YgiN
MIKIVAKMHVKPGEVENFKALAEDLIAKSRAEEGNILYTLNVNLKDPQSLAFVEFWKDQDAHSFHRTLPHYARLDEIKEEFGVEADVRKYFTDEEA